MLYVRPVSPTLKVFNALIVFSWIILNSYRNKLYREKGGEKAGFSLARDYIQRHRTRDRQPGPKYLLSI